MNNSLGKKFEAKFLQDWKKTFPDSFVYRLPDSMSGFAGAGGSNPCDFIAFTDGKLFLIECKEHKGASLPFSAIRQYDKLLKYAGKENVYPGILVWLSEKDIVFWVPIEELEHMKEDDLKSVGLKTIDSQQYNILKIPSEKKKLFLESDYHALLLLHK